MSNFKWKALSFLARRALSHAHDDQEEL